MAEETNTPPAGAGGGEAAPQQQVRPKLNILAQYIRDVSFENVAMMKGVKVEGTPDVSVQVALDANKKGENVYEVITKAKIESKSNGEAVFILELDYAGQFRVENVPDQGLHPFLMIECPRMTFPYLRRIIGDLTRDGGFPPLNVDNIDFLALYQQNLLRQQAAAAQANAQNGGATQA